jgi:Fe-S-cluster containining protein
MSCLCDHCSALCCRYFVIEIDEPTTRGDFDDVRWYLVHENVFVFIQKKKWYLGFYSRCKHLQADNRCGIYERRPRICRKYSTDNCDYHGGDYDWDLLFSSADQLERYAREKLKRRRSKKRVASSEKKRRKHRLPRLRPIPMLGGPHNGANGNGKHNGNGNGNGRFAMSLPVLRG